MLFGRIRLVSQYSTCVNNSYYVTTPIFYVNASPHIGHLYSAVVSDCAFRYNALRHANVKGKFSTGTDEHGTKIQQAAAYHKIPVHQYCNQISNSYRNVFNAANINYTEYIRTTEDRHKNSVKQFWNKLKQNDHIYSTSYSGWYCVSDETFLTESQLKTNPDGSKVSLDSGHPVDWTEEVNYMFKLSKFQDDVLYWIKQGDRVKPAKFEKILLDYLADPLPDVSVSRPSARVHWGVEVPDDSSQTIYVWLDALVNYLTCAGYPHEQYSEYWPPNLQVIGKDILKFHGIYWPAFLIAAGLEPPQRLLVHSHWTVDGQKMSKSKFNVVDPVERSQLYTMEGLRYFLLREGVPHSDGNYSDTKVLRILNSELADTLGNLLSRCCAKSLNPQQISPQLNGEHFESLSKLESTKRLIDLLAQLPDKCAHHYETYNFYLVVDQVMATLHAANNFFESSKPWELKTTLKVNTEISGAIDDVEKNTENARKLQTIISITMESLRVCAIILQPIIPKICEKLLDKLSIDKSQRGWENIQTCCWDLCNEIAEKNLGDVDSLLFKRIILETDKIKKQKSVSKG